MIDEKVLGEILASITAQQAREQADPCVERCNGTLRKLWHDHNPQQAFPPQLAEVDDMIALSELEAARVVLMASHAYNAGFRVARDTMHSSMLETIYFLAAEGFYLHLQGLWVALHRAGIPLDHEAVAARLLDTHGPLVSDKYAHEATLSAASFLNPFRPVAVPPAEHVH